MPPGCHENLPGPSSRLRLRFFRLSLLLALAGISHLAFTARSFSAIEPINDKVDHLGAFAFLALLADHSFPERGFAWKASALMAYGLLIEAVQAFLPHRSASLLDIAANGAGLAAYPLALSAIRRLRVPGGRR